MEYFLKRDGDFDLLTYLNKTILECDSNINTVIRLEKDKYELKTNEATSDFEQLMCNKLFYDTQWGRANISYNAGVKIVNKSNITIDGQGSTIVVHGLMEAIQILNCRNITIKNIVIDWDRPLFSIGEIIEVNMMSVKVKIHDEFPVKGDEPVWSIMEYNPKERHLEFTCQFRGMSSFNLIDKQVVSFKTRSAIKLKKGNYLVIRHIGNYRPAIYILDSSNIRLDNVTINTAAGMGVIGHYCKDININNLRVAPKDNRIMSTTTDATHFINCSGSIDFDNCYFEGMGDDAVNVHGFYMNIVEKIDEYTLKATIISESGTQDQLLDVPRSDDYIKFFKTNTLLAYADNFIESVEANELQWHAIIKLKNKIPDTVKINDVLAKASNLAALKFTNCTVRDNRARAVLIQTHNVLIENCLFDHCTGTAIHVNTAAGWWESIGTDNVTIKNNTIIECGYSEGTYKKASGIAITTECRKKAIGVHKNILIEKNTIEGNGHIGIYASCVNNLKIKNNNINKCKRAIVIKYCDSVILNNKP